MATEMLDKIQLLSGKWQAADDVAAHEFSNPDGGAIDTNGPLTLLYVDIISNSAQSLVAIFPSPSMASSRKTSLRRRIN